MPRLFDLLMEDGVLLIGGSKLRVQFIDFDLELIDPVPVHIALILDNLVNVACDLIKCVWIFRA